MAAYFFLIIAERFMNMLPRVLALGIGRFLGALWYFVDTRRRHIAKRNLVLAYAGKKSYRQVCRLARSSFRHMGMVAVDSLRIGKYLKPGYSDLIVFEGIELAEEAISNGKGLLLATPHFGNWELLVLLAQKLSRPLHSVARVIENPHIERHILRTRKLWGMHLIDKKNAARRILSCLKDNCAVGILMDQNAGREGAYVDFFGRKASTFTTVATMARRTGATVLILYSVMDNERCYRFVLEKPGDFELVQDEKENVLRITSAINKRFEGVIREHPEQYFWVHQRWKPIQNDLMRREFRRVENIIIKAPNWIGDVVMSLPVISYVRKVFPEAKIQLLIKESLADLVRQNPYVDGVMTYTLRKGPGRIVDDLKTIRRIRKEYFSLAVVLPYSVSSALWMFFAGIPTRLGSGVRNRGIVLTHAISPRREDEHQSDYFLRIAGRLGTGDVECAGVLRAGPFDEARAVEIVRDSCAGKVSSIVGIHPGAAYGPAKRWLPERFAELAVRLNKDGVSVVVFGSSAEKELVDEIVSQTDSSVLNLCGKLSLAELIAMLERCDVVITNDSGPMHIAAAVGSKVVALFGSTSPDATSPLGSCEIIWKKPECGPCFKRECPTDFRCMTGISTDEVYSAVRKLLELREA